MNKEVGLRRLLTPRVALLTLIVVLVPIVFLTAFHWIDANSDDAKWHYMGYIWTKFGMPPYRYSVENKSHGIFMLYALTSLFFGVNFLAAKLIGIVTILASAFLMYPIGRRLGGESTGVFALLIFGLSSCWQAVDGGFSNATEVFLVFFVVLGFWFLLKRHDETLIKRRYLYTALGGGCIGLAIAFKEIAVTSAVGLFLYILLDRPKESRFADRLKEAGIFAAGGVFFHALSLIPLLVSGTSFYDYIDGAWIQLFRPGTAAPTGAVKTIRIQQITRTWWAGRMHWFYPLLGLFVVQRGRLVEKGLPFAGLLVWFVFEFMGVNGSGITHGHQVRQALPPLALISALALTGLLESNLIAAAGKAFAPLITGLLIGFSFFPYSPVVSGWNNLKEWGFSYDDRELKPVGEWLKGKTSPSEPVYVFGRGTAALVMIYAERKSSSPKYFTNSFIYGYNIDQSEYPPALATTLEDFEKTPPRYILSPIAFTGKFEEPPFRIPAWFQKILDERYQKTDKVGAYEVYEPKRPPVVSSGH